MKPLPNLLSFMLIAVVSLANIGAAWSKPLAKKQPRKAVVPKLQSATVAGVLLLPVGVIAARSIPQERRLAPATPPANPYLAYPAYPAYQQPVAAVDTTRKAFNEFVHGVKMALPSLPMEGQAILPVIKTVYPTGEKPLVVVTFKCPTEMIGITPPPIKILHDLVTAGMDGVNRSDLLAFNMQQVCR